MVVISDKGALTLLKKRMSGNYDTNVAKTKTHVESGTDVDQYVVMNLSSAERKVILRKVAEENNTIRSLPGAVFQIERFDGMLIESTDINGKKTTTFSSSANSVYFIDKLPYGVYYLHETAPNNKYFFLVISNDTADGSRDGVYVSPPYDTRDAAETAYKAGVLS